MVGLIAQRKKPSGTMAPDPILKMYCKRNGLLYLSSDYYVSVSLPLKVRDFYSLEFILSNFSSIHPSITEGLEATYEKIKDMYVAECHLNHRVFGPDVSHNIVGDIIAGLLYGYKIGEWDGIYWFVTDNMFRGISDSRIAGYPTETYAGLGVPTITRQIFNFLFPVCAFALLNL